MPSYLSDKNGGKKFAKKSNELKKVINEAIFITESFGVPIQDLTPRRLEMMALCILSLSHVRNSPDWKDAKDLEDGISMRSRDIIEYINENFDEKISLGSYDDIRRKHLKLPVLAEFVVRTKPSSNVNDGTRGYAISHEHGELIRRFGTDGWNNIVTEFMKKRKSLAEKLEPKRIIEKIRIELPPSSCEFSPGQHNELQKAVVDEFLPRFGQGAEIVYIGDAAKKIKYINREKLKELNFFEISHRELPDIIAYSPAKNWLFLIEAVHSCGPMSKSRVFELKELTKSCKADIIFVSAFENKETFGKFMKDISWETEVWIEENPDHMIHFDGEKFLGPYK
jgi:hypothetical protein